MKREAIDFSLALIREVVLEAFREWDSECFHKFRGMFAVAIWSEYQQRLILARDRIGIKPLYFYQVAFRFILRF